jgi:hypothetical protein
VSVEYPAIDARGLIDDERYAAYKASLEERRRGLAETLVYNRHIDYPTMCRIAGEIASLDYALGLPDVLLASDPTSQSPITP